jgi:4a-hydroxytetrahydrobiopterin dehydratase
MNSTGSAGSGDAGQACDLTDRHCKPCEGGVPPLTGEQAQRGLRQLSGEWRLVEDGKALWREFAFRDFYRTMSFVNALAHIANLEDHHPDLQVGYNYCRVRYSTHAIGGLSDNDLICAAKIDQIPTT